MSLERAKKIIEVTKLTKSTMLDLRNLGLTNSEFIELMPKIKGISRIIPEHRDIFPWSSTDEYTLNLTALDLRDNNLSNVSALTELKDLPYLHLKLNGNNLSDVSFLKEMKKLSSLDLRSNVELEKTIPWNILRDYKHPRRIISAYFGIEDSVYQTYKDTPEKLWELIEAKTKKPDELKALHECRVVLIGQGNAGKTSLRQRILGSNFEDKGKTEGVEIEGTEFEVRGQNVRVNIWDFGGQEVYHSTHKFFFRARCLYILVVDVRAGMEKFIVKYWLRQIKELAKSNAPLIIVANKAEINDEITNNKVIDENYKAKFETLLEEFKAIYPNIKNVHYVSTNTPLNTDEVKQDVIKAIDKDLPEVFTTYPAYFAETRERFKADKDGSSKFGDFISKEEFENELSEEAKKDDKVVEILDVLGVFCHFKKNEDDNDDELEKMYVLNPEWITKGVYKILSSYILAEKKGKVTYADIKTILNKSVYEEKHNYIIKLMRRFKLCFVKNYQDKDYVIFPTWLPITETAYSPFITDISRFEYKYESETELEKAITNFIVDAQSNSNDDQDTYWRRGIVIRNNHLRSLVKADLESETLAITVEGEKTERNKKLSEIKSYFAKFHRENEIKVKENLFDEIGRVKDIIATSTSPDKHLLEQIPVLEKANSELQSLQKVTNEKIGQIEANIGTYAKKVARNTTIAYWLLSSLLTVVVLLGCYIFSFSIASIIIGFVLMTIYVSASMYFGKDASPNKMFELVEADAKKQMLDD
jgi:internalin A